MKLQDLDSFTLNNSFWKNNSRLDQQSYTVNILYNEKIFQLYELLEELYFSLQYHYICYSVSNICYICVYYLECIPVSVDSHVEYFYLRHLEANTDFAPTPINITMLSDYTKETVVNIGNSSVVVVRSNCYMSYSIYALFFIR